MSNVSVLSDLLHLVCPCASLLSRQPFLKKARERQCHNIGACVDNG